MTTSLRQIVDDQLVAIYEEERKHPKDYWRISGVGNPFAQYHDRLGSPRDPYDPYMLALNQLTMAMGTATHELINDLVRQSGAKVIFMDTKDPDSPERFEVREGSVVGHPDLAIEIEGKAILYDIKSVNSGAFTRMKKEGGGMIKPYEHHVKQITKYFDLVKKRFPEYDWEMRLLYISRDDGRREEIPVEFDLGILGRVDAEFKYLDECWEKKTPPPPPPQDSWMANPKYSCYTGLMNYDILDYKPNFEKQ